MFSFVFKDLSWNEACIIRAISRDVLSIATGC